MKEGVEVKKIGTTKLDNALHVKYHDAMYGFVVEFDLPKLGIPEELKNEWKESIDTEKENNLESQASANSELLIKKNDERDRLLKYIFGAVRNGQLSPEKDKEEAATRLSIVMNPYAGIRKESFDRETAHVDGLIKDLKKTENAADASKLGLSSDIAKLETVNKEFDTIYNDRSKKWADNKLPKTTDVRNRTDAIFERILLVLQYKYVYGATPVEPELIAKLIARFNKRAEEIDASYKQGLALRKAAAEKRKQNRPGRPPCGRSGRWRQWARASAAGTARKRRGSFRNAQPAGAAGARIRLAAGVRLGASRCAFSFRRAAGAGEEGEERMTSLDPGTGSTVRAAWFPT